MIKKLILLLLISILSFSCKSEKKYIYQKSKDEKTVSLIVKTNQILCPIELCGKQTIEFNDSIIDIDEKYYFLDLSNRLCYFDDKTNYIKNEDGENLFYVKLFDEGSCILVSAVSGNTYEFIRYKDN